MSMGSRLQSITPLEDPFSQFKDYLKLEVETLLTFSPLRGLPTQVLEQALPSRTWCRKLSEQRELPPVPQGIDPPSSGMNSEEFTQPP